MNNFCMHNTMPTTKQPFSNVLSTEVMSNTAPKLLNQLSIILIWNEIHLHVCEILQKKIVQYDAKCQCI